MTHVNHLNAMAHAFLLSLLQRSATALFPALVAANAWGADAPTPSARWQAAPLAEVRAAAEQGEATAQHALGERLLRGLDGKTDLLAAYKWFASAGSNGVVEAQLRMGMKHERAVGGARDIAEAVRWYELAAAKGNETARFRLGCLHSLNRYTGRLDGNETARWVQPLADRGHVPSLQLLRSAGDVLRATNVPPAQLLGWLREAAEAGGMADQRRLAEQLVGSDPKAAVYWWEVSRLNGNTNVSFRIAQAQARLSDAEIAVEAARAKQFKPKAATQATSAVTLADFDAAHHLAVELQPTAAGRAEFTRLELAAKGGDAEAQFQLALVHQLAPAFTNHLAALDGSVRRGNGVLLNNDRVPQPHLDEAMRWHGAAAKQGHRDAALALAWLHYSGVLGAVRMPETMQWFKVAAETGHAETAYFLYQLRTTGVGLEKPVTTAAWFQQQAETLGWLKRAAELGLLPAQTNLAAIAYAQGDQVGSLRLLRTAAERGDEGAKARLREWFGVTNPTAQAAPLAMATNAVATPRLAVVPLAEGLRPLADLLMAELSTKPGFTLLERTEIDRVFREQSLDAANTSAVKLGALLNAQGLVLLETNAVAGGAVANVRFVAVGPGVLLSAATLPLPLTNAPSWSQQLVTQFTPWLGKLGVPRGAAVPVSLLGLRMATIATDGREVEEGLSLLFLHRLTREREVFALERRRLEQLSGEQELTGGLNLFWSGGAVVEGTIEQELGDRTRLSVRLQVTPAGGKPTSFTAAGSTTNLAALADALTLKLLAELKKTPTGSWNPQEEAITFYEEARWLNRWGQWRPALAAMESAWALGLRGTAHALLRQELLLAEFRFATLRWPGTAEFPALLRQPPAPEDLDRASRALAAYTSYSRGLPPTALTNNPTWLAFGAATLELAAHTLEEFYLAPEARVGRTEQLAQLRVDTRTFYDYLRSLHEQAKSTGNWDKLDVHFRNRVLSPRHVGEVHFLGVELAYLRYWAERPEEVFALHRRLQGQPDYDRWRSYFVLPKPTPLVAWNSADRAALPTLWAAHLRNLASPTNLPGLFEQELAALRAVPRSPWQTAEPELVAGLGKFLDFAWSQRVALSRHAAGAHSFSTMLAVARAPFASYHGSTGHEPAGARLEAIVAGYEKRFREYQAEVGLPVAMAFLRDTLPSDPEKSIENRTKFYASGTKFDDLVVQPAFTIAQVRELIPLAKTFVERFGPAFNHPPGVTAGLGRLVARGTPPTTPPPSAPPPPPAVPVRPAVVAAPVTRAQPLPKLLPAPEALRVGRFWLAPEFSRTPQSFITNALPAAAQVSLREFALRDWQWAEDRLWLTWRHTLKFDWEDETILQESSHLAPVNLADLGAALSPASLPEPLALSRQKPVADHAPGKLAVLNGEAFLAETNGVWRIGQRPAERLNLDLVGETRVFAIHGRLLLSALNTLYLFDPKTGLAELLGSSVRRPAVSVADGLVGGLADAVAVPDQRLRIAFAGSFLVLEYDLAKKTWKSLGGHGQGHGWTRRMHADRIETFGKVTWNGVEGPYLSHILPHTSTNWSFAAFRLPPNRQDISLLSTGIRIPGVPLWYPTELDLAPVNVPTTAHSNLFWTVGDPDYDQVTTNSSGIHLALAGHPRLPAWRADQTQPAIIPLWPEFPTNLPAHLGAELSRRPHTPLNLLATPPGLVFDSTGVPGFWFLPWSEVLPCVEEQFTQLATERAARPPSGNHRGKQLLQTYDLDGDGKVSPVEFAVLFEGEKLNRNPNAQPVGLVHFNRADGNRDGKLDDGELSTIADFIKLLSSPNPAPGFGPSGFPAPGGPGFPTRPPGVPPGVGQPPRPGIPFGPGGAFAPGQMPQGPPPPEILERYDKNKNGKMDPDEMQELLRDQLRGTSPRPRGTNAPPGVPAPAPSSPPKKP
ncbi:MAG: hypothetical protein RL514_549 [Verrucomicrobiota bacterium]|jgi:TPR repeat protein/Ca2+-binding EF-hand superfamily protein